MAQNKAEIKAEARQEVRKEVIDYLENEYFKPGRPDRGTPKAEAILELVADLSQFLKDK